MGVDIIPIEHGWEALLDKYMILAKHSFATNDFGIVHTIIAEEQLSGIDHLATFHNHIDKNHLDPKLKDVAEELHVINAKTVQYAKDRYEDFHNTVANLKEDLGSKTDKPTWQEQIDDAEELTKQASVNALDDAINAAKEVIGRLPEKAHKSALDVFVSGFHAVQGFS